MPSITGWLRLEPLPRTNDLEIALEARIADPLWLLARQWQIGEFAGQDAGSPVIAQLQAEVGQISRFHAGALGPEDTADGVVDFVDHTTPLEVMVEREQVRAPGTNSRLAAEAGLHFGRLLDLHGEGASRAAFLADYPLASPDPGEDDPEGAASTRLYAGRVIDGSALYADLVAHRAEAAELTSLPPAASAPANSGVLAAANDYLGWWPGSLHEPVTSDAPAWKADRLEYGFAVSADMNVPPTGAEPSPDLVLHADEYKDGRLDWYSFRASTAPDLGAPGQPVPSRTVTRTVVPTQVTYSGQPADRFWGFEDAKVSFGELNTRAGDVGRFLLAEFALRYGDDWFIVPIDLAVGSVAVVESLTITDTFGIETDVPPSIETDSRWRMFTIAKGESDYVDAVFFLAPTLVSRVEGEAVEHVALFRDELANMVWGVERQVLGSSGHVIDRYAEHQRSNRSLVRPSPADLGIEDAEIVYRLASNVPRHWVPFVPVPAPGTTGPSAIQLERRAMTHYGTDGSTELVQPRGRVLSDTQPGQALVLAEEEVPRAGAVVDRSFQLTRWTDGSRHLWMGRRTSSGRGEGSSGLRFDYTDQI